MVLLGLLLFSAGTCFGISIGTLITVAFVRETLEDLDR